MRSEARSPRSLRPTVASMGVGSWMVLFVLLALLVAAGLLAYAGWTHEKGPAMPAAGYLALAFGVVASMAVGIGLMALIFYSSRRGYDQPPTVISTSDLRNANASSSRRPEEMREWNCRREP